MRMSRASAGAARPDRPTARSRSVDRDEGMKRLPQLALDVVALAPLANSGFQRRGGGRRAPLPLAAIHDDFHAGLAAELLAHVLGEVRRLPRNDEEMARHKKETDCSGRARVDA